MFNVPELADKIYFLGARDWHRRIFDALIPLPQGTTYNAYLVKGSDQTALIDTVNPGFEPELLARLSQVMEPGELDYVVMNHAEPDHAGAIPAVLQASPRAKLITTAKGASMARTYFQTPEERIMVVKDSDTVTLGDKTLRFLEAPWLHWPETMFTYAVEERVLFSCDFFGAHTAFGLYEDEVEDLPVLAKRYFGEIMMPFRLPGQKALRKLADLEIGLIAPSHGPVYRNPKKILAAYQDWTSGVTGEKATLVYASMWQSTEKMVFHLAEVFQAEAIQVCLYNLVNADLGDIAKDLVDSRALVLGTPTVLGGMHPLALFGAYLVKALRPPAKYGAVLSSYGWGGGALRQISEILSGTNIELAGAVEVLGPPTAETLEQVEGLGHKLAGKIKG
ncbi:MAG: FprA family A-type flavoprotein [Thermodesulfobacteriota bacterium]